jgi:hypothetical protein
MTDRVIITTRTPDISKTLETIESGRAQAAEQIGCEPDEAEICLTASTSVPLYDDDGETIGHRYVFKTTWKKAEKPAEPEASANA